MNSSDEVLRGLRGIATAIALIISCETAHLQAASTLEFVSRNFTVAENQGCVLLTVRRINDVNTEVSVQYATLDGTAKDGTNYSACSNSLAFGVGVTNVTITVPILNAAFVQSSLTFQVVLSNPSEGAVLGSYTNAIVNIQDNDVGVSFQWPSYSVSEDAGEVVLRVVRGDDGPVPITVNLATADLSARNAVDYVGTNSTVSFSAQQRLGFVHVPILNNTGKQANRTFRATLSNPVGGSLGPTPTTVVTILDNDSGFQFETNNYVVMEDAGAALIGVLRGTDDISSTSTVDIATSDASAISGRDYRGLTNTQTFAPAQRRGVVSIPILNNGTSEGSRYFRVNLSNPTGGAVLGSPVTTTITILDNDPGLGFEYTAYTNARGKVGNLTAVVLRGNDGVLGPISVNYATGGGTAMPGVDYQPLSGRLDFVQGQTVQSLSIPILSAAPNRTFQVTLSNPTGGVTLRNSSATVNIGGSSVTVLPPYDAGLAIRQEFGVNAITWGGGGTLQRADAPAGPWQTLANANSPYLVQSPVSTAFYRVAGCRTANLYIPSGYDGHTLMPLVVLLGGRAPTNYAYIETLMNFQPLAESRGILYCCPEGTVDAWGWRFWNATDAAGDFGNTGVDDVGCLRSLIQEITGSFAVDRKRVYVVGHSQGGFMAYRMACESSDLVAAIVSFAGATFLDTSRCAPSERVQVLEIHGTADTSISYIGGANNTGAAFVPANMPPYPGAVQSVQIWACYNGASGPVTDSAPSLDLTTAVAGSDTVVTRYTACPPGGTVELWSIIGADHVPSLSSNFSALIIDWLLAHPKP